MDTRQLEYILTIAEEKNLTRAADRLFLTQSALSQQLSKLEAEGLPPLFTRHKGEMQLTDAGKIYINGARSILKIKGDAQEALKDLSQAKIHHIHIGVCRLFQPLYYERILPWLKRSYPDVEVTAVTPEDLRSAIALAKMGECAALIPKSLVRGTGLACSSLNPPFHYQNTIVIRRGTPLPIIRDICDWIQRYGFRDGCQA